MPESFPIGAMNSRFQTSCLILILAVSAFLRFYQIGEESIWGDEASTLGLVSQPSFDAISRAITTSEANPPLYFFLAKMWGGVFSNSLVSIRSFSAVISLLTIPLFWFLARRMIGDGTSLLATLFLGLSPFHLWYAQEARMYSLLVFWEVLIVLFAFDLWSRPLSPRRWILESAGLFVATAGAVFTHFYYLFIVAFVGLYWMFHLTIFGRREMRSALTFACWCVWTIALSIPGFLQMTRQMQTGQNIGWIPPLSVDTFHGILNSFCYGVFILPKPWWIIIPSCVAFAMPLVAAFPRSNSGGTPSDRPDARFLLLPFFACALGLPLLVSIFHPIVFFGQRYEIIATIPFYLLVALGLSDLRLRFGPIAPLLLSSMILGGMVRYHVDYFDSRQKRPFDVAAKELDRRFHPGDMLVMDPPYTHGALIYYLRQPYKFLPFDAEQIRARVASNPKATLWFVSVRPIPSPVELEAVAGMNRLRIEFLELEDIPEEILRLAPYKLDIK